jgi:hypothetical protein
VYFGIDSTHGIFAYQEEVFPWKVPELRNANATEQKDTQLALSLSFIGGGAIDIVVEWLLLIDPKEITSP